MKIIEHNQGQCKNLRGNICKNPIFPLKNK